MVQFSRPERDIEAGKGVEFRQRLLDSGDQLENRVSLLPTSHKPVDIIFKNLEVTVNVKSGFCGKKETKTLLRDVCGSINSGHLTALMGPSGAGKTTLMNILAGCKTPTNGRILVNGKERDMSEFREMSCYIMQYDEFLPHLTVLECMIVASHVKKAPKKSFDEKLKMIDEILTDLGLAKHKNTKTSQLSGGQRKRLSIAQELVNNPQVMFLDEPTSGLDSQASFECIGLLKRLVKDSNKRTIICTIHQPSAKLFELFDKLYVMSEGACIYRGSIPSVLPYLSSQGLECPPYHNPADFVIEVACGVYGNVGGRLAKRVRDGDCDCLDEAYIPLVREQIQKATKISSNMNPERKGKPLPPIPQGGKKVLPKRNESFLGVFDEIVGRNQRRLADGIREMETSNDPRKSTFFVAYKKLAETSENSSSETTSTSMSEERRQKKVPTSPGSLWDWRLFGAVPWSRFSILFWRTFKCIIFDMNLSVLRLISHVVVGLLIGWLYYDIGNDARPHQVLQNKSCMFLSLLFLMFTALMPTVMTFPLEKVVFLRQHLNCWYSLSSYYFAKTLADMPFQIFFPLIYTVIIYFMTGQPLEATRFFLFLLVSVLVSLNAQSLGLLIGAATSLQVAVFLGPVTAIPILLFSGFFIPYTSITIYLQWISYLSYIRYAYECTLLAIYDFSRALLNVKTPPKSGEIMMTDPKKIISESGLEGEKWYVDVIIMLAFFLAFRVLAYLVLLWRVRGEQIRRIFKCGRK